MARDPEIVEIDMAEVQELLARTKDRLPSEDYDKWRSLVETLLTLMKLVQERGTTIARLRRLFGLASSEKTADVLEKIGASEQAVEAKPDTEGTTPSGGEKPPADEEIASAEEKAKRKGHGRNPASAYPDACPIAVLHESLRPGDECPACGRGTLFELREPARLLRIVGQPPLVAVCWNCQRLRCSGCGAVFTARAPDEAQGPKHSETAAAMMACLRYGGGMPHNRLEHLQRHLATPLPASTQWDVVSQFAGAPALVYGELLRLGAQGSVVHNDDTYMRILALMGKRRAQLLRRGGLPDPERTGLFTTAVVSIVDGRTLALFFTGRKHAGENLADILRQRAADLEPPILMCDALDRNLPKGHKVIESNCGSHARRRFVDQAENFPTECRYLLETFGKVFKVDELCRTQRLSDDERLRQHEQESGPVMAELKTWMQDQFLEKRVEPNSGLGEAIRYMLVRWDKFTLFLKLPGAPLHNNIVERALKLAIRHRNNSLFYRSERGARVGDIYMTLIHTTELQGENPFHYLTQLMCHESAVAEDPAAWLPWNYRDTLACFLRDATSPRDERPRPL
jgi:transposase